MNKQVVLKTRPTGQPTLDNFELTQSAIPRAADGEIVIRAHYLTVDPYMRGRMDASDSYIPPFELGKPCEADIVGEVVECNNGPFPVGTFVTGLGDWALYSKSDGEGFRQIPAGPNPIYDYLGVLGYPGMTAWVGLNDIAGIKAGENVFVSAASGAVGQVVGQVAKAMGCRVSGTAGSDEKVAWLREIGFDDAFNYRRVSNLAQAVAATNPDGIDVYFENVGGPLLEAVIGNMNLHGRIVLCGMIADYNASTPEQITTLPRNLMTILDRSIRMQGFIVTDFHQACQEWLEKGAEMRQNGNLKYRETVTEGIEKAPQALLDVLNGRNFGKQIVKLA